MRTELQKQFLQKWDQITGLSSLNCRVERAEEYLKRSYTFKESKTCELETICQASLVIEGYFYETSPSPEKYLGSRITTQAGLKSRCVWNPTLNLFF